jgi:hypothetical protein
MEIDYSKYQEDLQKVKKTADVSRVSFVVDGEKLYGMFYGYPLVKEGEDPVCLIWCDNGRYYVIKEKDVKWNDKQSNNN